MNMSKAFTAAIVIWTTMVIATTTTSLTVLLIFSFHTFDMVALISFVTIVILSGVSLLLVYRGKGTYT